MAGLYLARQATRRDNIRNATNADCEGRYVVPAGIALRKHLSFSIVSRPISPITSEQSSNIMKMEGKAAKSKGHLEFIAIYQSSDKLRGTRSMADSRFGVMQT
ncbi:hypothetical protein ANN_01048 [Periplaneta americana]|uniref:Uncharacterized protein n=1 Tax=Periplaneta americana TaxID=6978 RepID=A0ABQ8TVR2_PERAM|nr:hypothetical protein ANN_01048 [Periplaneta americana]